MVHKRTEDQIRETMDAVRADVSPSNVRGWCSHLDVRREGLSLVGQMVDLPIGNKSIGCSQIEVRYEASSLRPIAESFIAKHCPHCPYHALVAAPNIGTAIVERVLAAEVAAAARDDERARADALLHGYRLPGVEPIVILAADITSQRRAETLTLDEWSRLSAALWAQDVSSLP